MSELPAILGDQLRALWGPEGLVGLSFSGAGARTHTFKEHLVKNATQGAKLNHTVEGFTMNFPVPKSFCGKYTSGRIYKGILYWSFYY